EPGQFQLHQRNRARRDGAVANGRGKHGLRGLLYSGNAGGGGVDLQPQEFQMSDTKEYRGSRIEDRGSRIENRQPAIFYLRSSILDLQPSLTWSILLAVFLALGAVAQNWMDSQRRAPLAVEEALYFNSGEALKRSSLGFDGLMATSTGFARCYTS